MHEINVWAKVTTRVGIDTNKAQDRVKTTETHPVDTCSLMSVNVQNERN